jgi:hypothetical protein
MRLSLASFLSAADAAPQPVAHAAMACARRQLDAENALLLRRAVLPVPLERPTLFADIEV